jgi:uncharacterized protein (DUF488 family)
VAGAGGLTAADGTSNYTMPAMLAQGRFCHAAADSGGGPVPGDSSSHRRDPRPGGVRPFFTIGHSTRPLAEFIGLLREARVELLIDVRLLPRSRTNPQYNQDALPQALAAYQIGYEHIAALGGRRGKSVDVAPSINAFWQNAGFHNYADYAMSVTFHAALEQLRELGHARICAIMCAEAVWWRCHRRIIADYLLAAGETVLHIMGAGHIVPAEMTKAAERDKAGMLVYPAEQGTLL